MKKEDIQAALEAFSKSGITVNGDLVLEKKVEYEVANVESGGIGIQIVGESGNQQLTVSEKHIKAALEQVLAERDSSGKLLFQNKKQWWAVFRVLSVFCNYPNRMTAFLTKMTDMGVDYGGNPNVVTYDSLAAASKDVPLMATCSPAAWDALKDKSDSYRQQYVVADFLMQKLGIKS